MNVVDSSGWLEYFSNGANADFFASPIEDVSHLVVPSISFLEVFKRITQQRGEDDASKAVTQMHGGLIVDLDERVALSAARIRVVSQFAVAALYERRNCKATKDGGHRPPLQKDQTETPPESA
ncbi:MAG TPA: type II toxin-antitoxin system VapC family toxin [Terriglobia bacterium]|nr:type II toxin-antitoxin system VapC family toxin [Terriglobia bacterium]